MRASGSMATFALHARLHGFKVWTARRRGAHVGGMAVKAMRDGSVILQDAEFRDWARRMLRVAERSGQTVQARVVGQLVLKILTVEPADRRDALRTCAKGPLDLVHREFPQSALCDAPQRLSVVRAGLPIELRWMARFAGLRSHVRGGKLKSNQS